MSFNPYSGGCAFRRITFTTGREFYIKFQSLFWWMCFQKLLSTFIIPELKACFNPYSGGCAFRRIFCQTNILVYYRFNPYYGGCAFRSQLCWFPEWRINCFNPYSGGCAFRSYIISCCSIYPHFVSILILVDVLSEVYIQRKTWTTLTSFNPYSGGCAFRRSSVVCLMFDAFSFQSLFWWMCFQKRQRTPWSICYTFVSILILVDVLSEGFTTNTMFYFLVVSILILVDVLSEDNEDGCWAADIYVSILILVDVLSEDCACYIGCASCRVSILILVDVLSEDRKIDIEKDFLECFNPYSGGCAFRSNVKI